MRDETDHPIIRTDNLVAHEAWEQLTYRLNKTHDLKGCTFFLIIGLFRMKGTRPFRIPYSEVLIARPYEVLIPPQDDGYDSVYHLPMGESAILKLLFSRPTFGLGTTNGRRTLQISYGAEVFEGVSKFKLFSDNRYNQEKIIFVCKRVLDSFLSRVSIEQQSEVDVQSPNPFLLITIDVPRHITLLVVLGVVFTAILVALDSELIKYLGSMFPDHAEYVNENAKTLSALAKAISPLPVGVSAYLAFRKLPLK